MTNPNETFEQDALECVDCGFIALTIRASAGHEQTCHGGWVNIVVDSAIPAMEIATKNGAISWFDDFGDPGNPNKFLSNFYPGTPLQIRGFSFRTGEHAFQAMKATTQAEARRIEAAPNPSSAKALGRSALLRKDWEAVKYDAMMVVLRTKFTLKRAEGKMLLDTGNQYLVEGTFWGDQVWGVALEDGHRSWPRSPGRNWLGTLIMARRAELVAQLTHRIPEHPTLEANLAFSWGWSK
jgi:ribA/ribD-fused uncharacterized protein